VGWWNVDADTLAGSRFVLSPLAETMAGLIRLHRGFSGSSGGSAGLGDLGAFRARLAADPVDAAVVGAVLRPRWIANFASPAPSGLSFAAEIAAVRATPAESIRADLVMASTAGRSFVVPSASSDFGQLLARDDLGDRVADLLTWVWERTVEPDWERRRRILEADVIARTRQLSDGGWAAALDRMRDGMRWLGEGRLQINAFDYPPFDISGTRLTFVPVTMTGGWVAQSPGRHAVIYRCSGLLAPISGAASSGALGRLLGDGRARVLLELDPAAPKSTTQLVAITGQALGSVGRHLKILLDAGLVLRRRAGRSVLYARTPAGDAVVSAAG
jgi:DNA-binding transcriptional ArsR family regulator